METSSGSTGEPLNGPTSSPEAIPANRSQRRAKEKAKKTRGTSGHGYETPLAIYDPGLRSWKTSEDISLWGEPSCLGSLPKSGMTRSGVLYLQPDWVRPIDATESSSWPTPTAVTRPMEGNVRLYRAKVKEGEMTEAEAEAILGKSVWEAQGKLPAMLPTPTASEHKYRLRGDTQASRCLEAMARRGELERWPTPTTVDTFTPPKRSNPTLGDAARQADGSNGKLNPTWVEWLMGFPLGWTDLEDSGTPLSPKLPNTSDGS
jgi:hypothetical protein